MAAAPRKHQKISLRGASAKEITRDALLERVSNERELRNYTRRAAAAAILIQRVWRGCHSAKKAAGQIKKEWESLVIHQNILITSRWISSNLLRPFIFFVTYSLNPHLKLRIMDVKVMLICFKILLQSINSNESNKNICSLAMGTPEEKSTWLYQARKLLSICSIILAEFDHTNPSREDTVELTALAMHLTVALTDSKGWKTFKSENFMEADTAVNNLMRFIASGKSGLYSCIRRYFLNFVAHSLSQTKGAGQTDNHFLITASAVTLALRPFHVPVFNVNDNNLLDVKDASEQYCTFLLSVPLLPQCLPVVLLRALKHKSVLLPCLKTLLISKEKILLEMSKLDQSKVTGFHPEVIPCAGWALANIINLATEYDNESGDSICFVQGLDCRLYVHVVTSMSENVLCWLENVGQIKNRESDGYMGKYDSSINPDILERESSFGSLKMSYIDLFKPVHQQWHLLRLLDAIKNERLDYSGKLELLDIAFFYSYMLQIFYSLNPLGGSLPILNMLSFTPGFLVELWGVLESSILHEKGLTADIEKSCSTHNDGILERKQGRVVKDAANKWVTVLQKITGKSSTDIDCTSSVNCSLGSGLRNEDCYDLWDIESLRRGPQGVSKEWSCLLHLFCATYAHLLLVLDDIEFYEKQVPFTLEKQRTIASVLNTLVYNGFSHSNGQQNKPLMDAAVRCLHLLYERDCRHKFCPPSLWIAPARKGRPSIAAAARAHEAVSANLRTGDSLSSLCMGSVITTTPHVYPFEERVQMFREFIKLDKVSRRMAGEVVGPGPGSIEIVVRRDHIVEDGFRQLNFLGSRLKSRINVSFVSECGLSEAGLDYGGLSKEFLTDISKAAFDPEYGLFFQTSTSERFLIPNTAARLRENGMQMIEFLGRVVGKALYEGILLDYSFSLVFVQKLLGRYSFLDELSTLDPELYRNLMYVKHYDGDVKELCLDFTVTDELLGKKVVTELKPGGENVAVTNENKLQYVYAIADYKLNRQILPLANAFYRGLIDIISPSWLSLFNAGEFNQLLSGGKHDIDVDDLRSNTRYTGGYSEGSRTIKLFWEVITGFEPKERCMLLKFVTSCSRAPLLGFKHLQPTFTIHKVACDVPLWAMIGGQDVEHLPSASTCYNTLKLPTYKRPSTLKNKLLYAINSNAGFELS
ncbi:ubiquitin-protein ligase 7 [Tasmannia lanceolata]|uniref:ubiquitin-protein ligase 7 n=1 Tax=Tasmannia lanceolata TaxID=3420 RepID=UPI004063C85A